MLTILDENDSLRLIVEIERIVLLKKMGDRIKLLISFNSAISLAEERKDYNKLSRLLCLKGLIYAELGFKVVATRILSNAHEVAVKINKKDNRSLRLAYYYSIMSVLTDHLSEKVFSLNKSYDYFMAVSDQSPDYRAAQISGNSSYALAFMEEGKLDSASHYLSLAISHLDPNNVLLDDHYAVLNYARLYHSKKDYKNAKKWLLYGLNQAQTQNDLHSQGTILYSLYNTEYVLGGHRQANEYLQSYASLKQELDRNQKRIIGLVDSQLTDFRKSTIMQESKTENKIVTSSIIAAFLASAAIAWFFIKNQKKVQDTGTESSLRLLKEETQLIETNVIEGNFVHKETPALKELSDEPAREITVAQINELNNLIKTDDPSFMVKFHEYFPTFARTVSGYAFPPLNNSEIEICAYTKLNFSTKEIALYRHYTLRSVENRKYRIRKKLLLGPEVDFIVWISSIK